MRVRVARLLFVLNTPAITAALGDDGASEVQSSLANRDGGAIVDLAGLSGLEECAGHVRSALEQHGSVDGVVLVGGYDVIPGQRLDCLGSDLRRRLPAPTPDPDDFIVWSDDVYGDRDGDGLPELPVSRLPDCHSPDFLRRLLTSSTPTLRTRAGLRNAQRPYASEIFATLPGTAELLTSETVLAEQQPTYDLAADLVYVVLHGKEDDGTRQFGESADASLLALTIASVGRHRDSIVLCASCWGGLIVDATALRASSDRQLRSRTPRSSVALAFLSNGASAFVGCTGSHYSPVQAPYRYNGGPLHQAFWNRLLGGAPPARALFEAKYHDYGPGIPHGQFGTTAHACELKVLYEFTCLGLGW